MFANLFNKKDIKCINGILRNLTIINNPAHFFVISLYNE